MNTPSTKKELRRAIESLRTAQSSEQVKQKSARIAAHLQTLDSFKASQSIGLYMAIQQEVDLTDLFQACWDLNKQTYIPYFNAVSKTYEMAAITPNTEMIEGHYGILEPKTPQIIPVQQIDFFVVPGVAFDKAGRRLGRGGGYYDRLLAHFSGHLTAVAFELQLVETVPTESHDQLMHTIVTEHQVVSCI